MGLLYLLSQFRNSFFSLGSEMSEFNPLGLFNSVVSTAEFVTDFYERTDMHCGTGRFVKCNSTAGTTGENREQLG